MKNRITPWAWLFGCCFLSVQAFAQTTVNMPFNTGTAPTFTIAPPTTCFFNFFDNGGQAANYSNGSVPTAASVTFAPSNPATHKIRATFTAFTTEATWDALYVRDGANTGAALIASPNPIGNTFMAGGWWGANPPTNLGLPANQVQATPGNASGALTFQFDSDGSVTCLGWAATVSQVPITPCVVTAPATATATLPANVCVTSATINGINFTPAGCAATLQFQYSLNGGTPVVIPASTSVTIPNLGVGATSILWQLVDPCGGVVQSSATTVVTILDTQPPVFTNCPSSTTINLGPGECGINYTYPCITATDCGIWVLAQGNPNNQAVPWSFTGQRQPCWNVVNQSAIPLNITSVSVMCWNNSAAAQNVKLDIYYTTVATVANGNESNPAAWTLAGSATVTMPANQVLIPLPYTVPLIPQPVIAGGTSKGYSCFASLQYGGGPCSALSGGANFSDGNIACTIAGLQNGPTPFSNANGGPFPDPFMFHGGVNYIAVASSVNNCANPNLVVASGGTLPSGSFLHKDDSPFTFTYTVADPNNPALTATCSWTVTVNEYPNAITTLVCNDMVEISLDATCTHSIGADEVLEGGPYGCYDDYIVMIDKVAPYGNGPWVPADLGPGDVGRTYGVKIIDPDTGNSCWGLIKIEDKLPPVLDCPSVNVPCNANITPGGPLSGTATFTANFPIAQVGTSNGTVNVAMPVGATVTDVNVSNVNNHTWVSDINMTVTSPLGVARSMYDRPGIPGPDCAGDGINALFDDEAPNTAAQFETTCGNNPAITGNFQPIQSLDVYDGTNVNGAWNINFQDFVGGDGATSNITTLFFAFNATVPFPNGLVLNNNVFLIGNRTYRVTAGAGTPILDACSDVTLSYIDTETAMNCLNGSPFTKVVTRKWTAVDASGNTATCIQTFNFLVPATSDVVLPPNYDDIDEAAFDCGIPYPTPDWIEGQGLQGYPWIAGSPIGCTIGWKHEDLVIDVCDGTYKIRRKWTVINWCTGEEFEANQIIKVIDDQGPVWACPANITVGTDPFQCCATVNLPDAIVEDGCSRINSVNAMIVTQDCDGNVLGMQSIDGQVRNFPGNNYWDLDTLGWFANSGCLPLGRHNVIYTAVDDCGNASTCGFSITVLDLTPPQINCVEFTVVTVGYDDPNDCYVQDPITCEFAGVSWVDAEVFDKGSFDNCNSIYFTVRRMPTDTIFTGNFGQVVYNGFIDTLNQQHGTADCFDPFTVDFPVTEYQQATGLTSSFINLNANQAVYPFPQGLPQNHPYPAGAGYETLDALLYQTAGAGCQVFPDFPLVGRDSIKFYCDEVGTTQTVILRGYQIDAQGRLQLDANGEPVYNECMVNVSVQDKIRPTCIAPANVTVSCEAFDPSLWAYGYPQAWDNCCLDVTKQIVTNIATYKGITESDNYALFDTLCNRGTITRTWRVYDCAGLTNICTQRVFVNYNQDYHVRFPDDRVVFDCDGTTAFGEPVINKKDCELIAVGYEDHTYTVVPDACYKIERVWTVMNWCTYNANLPCTYVPNPEPNALPNATANRTGPTVSQAGTPAPWAPTLVALLPGQPPTDFSTFWSANANCYEYKQIIKVIDNEDPVIDSWQLDDCDVTANDPLFWNTMDWWDPIHQTHDLCEAPVNISLTAIDSCSGSNVDIRALLFLDLNGDGIMETVLNTNGTNFTPNVPNGVINYNNYQNLNYSGGTPREFDHRPVPVQLKYRFAVRDQVIGGKRKLSIMWTDRTNPNANNNNDWVLPQIPLGKHKIKWFVEDNCGNETFWESPWDLHDCKAPTVVCYNGLSVNIMPTGMIAIWAIDFLQYMQDNCTPADQLLLSIRKSGTGTGFPVDANGNPIPGVTFTCSELGTQYVEIWSKDAHGNASYCETYIIVQDPDGNCSPNTKATVSGDVKTDGGQSQGVEDATVSITAANSNPGQPSLDRLTGADGHYLFNNAIPVGHDYTITPLRDDNPLNGVSTYDLLLITKHILGVQPLNTPYKMIAADANKNGTITSYDVLALRRLILGLDQELQNNTSWRFVDKSFAFPNPSNPFATQFPEGISVANLQANLTSGNFVGVKIGDVSGDAVPNNVASVDDRTAGTLMFDVQDQAVKAGEEFVVNFKAAEKVLGYQFTMNYSNLEVVDVVPGAGMKSDNFAVFAKEGALTTSFDGEAQGEFSVKFRALAAGQISKMIGVSSRITKAEAYSSDNRYEVAFRFNNNGQTTIAGVGFELYQNQPNPFVSKTVIGFNLPEATEATLTIFDETGRTLFTQKGDFAKGTNAISIDRAVLNTTGVMYYKLETATDSASKKMIQTK